MGKERVSKSALPSWSVLVHMTASPVEARNTTQPFTLHMHPAEASSSLKKIHHRGGPLLQRGSPFPPCF